MITRVRIANPREAALRLPAFGIALGGAESFFRFGSFALECLAFLALWAALDAVTTIALGRRATRPSLSNPRSQP